MRIRSLSVLMGAIFMLSLFGLAMGDEAAKPAGETVKPTTEVKHEYVGAKKCSMCHKKDGVFESWSATKHATVWESLSAEDQKKDEFKKYYTTGTTAKGDLLTGVECEACHGPGSDYMKMAIMKDPEKAIENGLIIPDVNTCLKCHNDKTPAALAAISKDFNFEKMKATGVHKKMAFGL